MLSRFEAMVGYDAFMVEHFIAMPLPARAPFRFIPIALRSLAIGLLTELFI